MVVIWAVNFSVAKFALATLPPLAFNALRFPLASIVVLVVLRAGGAVPLPDRADVPRVVLLGLVGNTLYQLLFISGLSMTHAGIASLLLAGSPIITALLSAAVGHERVGVATWLGVVGTVAGMVLVVGGGPGAAAGGSSPAGEAIMLGASLSWSIYTVGARGLIQRYGPIPMTAWTLWIGTVGIVLLGIPSLRTVHLAAVPADAWGAVAFSGALSIGLAYLLWYRGVSRLGNTRTSTYSNLVPVLALLAAWVWLGEVPRPVQLVGAAVILGGVTLARRSR